MIFDARGKKRVVAVADQLMASAAYYLGASAEELVVTPSGEVGSIGVYMVHFDWSGAFEDAGVRATIIRAGARKAEGNPYEPLPEEAVAHFQSLIDDYHDLFIQAVARGRGVSAATVRESFGQGRTYTAQRAVERGMADRVATIEEVVRDLKRGRRGPGRRANAPAPAPAVSGSSPTWQEALALASPGERRAVRLSCLHEAGHAVALVMEGQGVLSAGIRWSVEDGRFVPGGGFCVADDPSREMPPSVVAAGYAALLEAGRITDWREAGRVHDGAAGDLARLEEMAGPDGASRALREARYLVRTHWTALQAVADALEAKGRLSGAEATLLVLEHLEDWERERLGYGSAA